MRNSILTAMAMIACLVMGASVASADVTGDFKVVSATYLNPGTDAGGDVAISGTVNRGAVQSGKRVVVDVTYELAYLYSTTFIETTTTTPFCDLPGNADKQQCLSADANSSLKKGKTTTTTVTKEFAATDGMSAITEATVTNGRLNPKGKVTGYNWSVIRSLVPVELVPELPDGAVLVSAEIAGISYTAYLKDANGDQIADTVFSGILFQ